MDIYEWGALLGIDQRRIKGEDDFWTMCPCHRDKNPALHVYLSYTGQVMMKCFVCGAELEDVSREIDRRRKAKPKANSVLTGMHRTRAWTAGQCKEDVHDSH